ncbi:pectinesterase family protein [Dinghuibacter silviterrae]|uniref:pectinesterase family protein n=1 Tax=Dinghuibacter silviterrae TaxID=1539049 RepID=UPI001B8733BB|nr:pectinesterase family protein [Dinghuibacter silviterrae]
MLSLAIGHRVTVAPDGSGDFRSIQAAVNAIPYGSDTTYTIFIKKGIYHERVLIAPGRDHISLVGESEDSTVITYGLHTGSVLAPGDTVNTWVSATCWVEGYAFHAEHLSIANDAPLNAGQAVALEVSGSRASFDHCRLLGNQDVLFCQGPGTLQYYKDCYIEGTTDFVFGAATAVLDHCEIHSLRDSYIAAPSTPADSRYGIVFLDCRLTADPGVTKVFLGRPWRAHAAAAYIRCTMGAHILPEGWNNWKNPAREKTARFSEFRSTGPGAAPGKRVGWSRQLDPMEAAAYTPDKILGGKTLF